MRSRLLKIAAVCVLFGLSTLASLWLNGFLPYLSQPLPWANYAWASLGVLVNIATVLTALALLVALFFLARRVFAARHGSPT